MLIMTPRRAAALLLVVPAMAACSGDQPGGRIAAAGAELPPNSPIAAMTAPQLLKAARRAAAHEDSVTVSGVAGGSAAPSYRFLLTNRGITGFVTTGRFGSVDLTAMDGAVWLRGGSDLYAQLLTAREARAAAGKWLRIPRSTARDAGLLQWDDKDRYLDSLLEPNITARLKKAGVARIEDRIAVGLAEPHTPTLWISAEGTHLPMQVSGEDGTVTVRLDDWGGGGKIKPPDSGSVIVVPASADAGRTSKQPAPPESGGQPG